MQVAGLAVAWRSPWCPAALRPAVPPCSPCPAPPGPLLAAQRAARSCSSHKGWKGPDPVGLAAGRAASAASSVGGSFPPPDTAAE